MNAMKTGVNGRSRDSSVSRRSIDDSVDFESMLDNKPEPGLELETGLAIPWFTDSD